MKMRLVAGASIVCPLNCGRSAGPEDPRECQQARCIFAQHGPNKSPARERGSVCRSLRWACRRLR